MDRTLLFGAAVVLFCVRDGRLLASRPPLALVALPVLLAVSAGCGLFAERLSVNDATAWLVDGRFWIPAALLHALLSFRSARRGRTNKRADWISLLPAPVWCVAITGGARMALARFDDVTGLSVGLALGAAYAAAVGSVAIFRRLDPDARAALRFASVTHMSAILLVPAAAMLDRPLSSQPVDWIVTGIVTSFVVLILGLSFALHRLRGR